MIAEGGGWIGPNLEYLDNLVEHLATLGLSDPEIDALHRRAHAMAEASAAARAD
jgi:cation transport regulator ChaC